MSSSLCKQCRAVIEYVAPAHRLRGNGQFCSRRCFGDFRSTRPDVACKTCGKVFTAKPTPLGWQKFCSMACSGAARRTKQTQRCKQCRTKFDINPSQFRYYAGAGQFCSKKCHGDAVAAWWANQPITDRYGRTKRRADNIWQLAVREKFNYTCQRCGTYDRYIHAHHVAPRSQRPDLKHDVGNGMTLCNSCHTWVHQNPEASYAAGWLSQERYEAAA